LLRFRCRSKVRNVICNTLGSVMTESTPLAIVRSFDDLRDLFRARVAELNISLDTLDEISGLPVRYSSKLLALEPSKQLGAISFSALLGALALQLVAMEDAEALARIQRRLVPVQKAPHPGWRADILFGTHAPLVAIASVVMA
jgi:hypothetical protein